MACRFSACVLKNFYDHMSADLRFSNWSDYSYEETLEKLASRYPTSNIVIVVPSRHHLGGYSCYDNFMECDKFGKSSLGITLCLSLPLTLSLSLSLSLFLSLTHSLTHSLCWCITTHTQHNQILPLTSKTGTLR